jgi:hypothetical protein
MDVVGQCCNACGKPMKNEGTHNPVGIYLEAGEVKANQYGQKQ